MLTGEKRIKADRMWRSASERRRFEDETGTPPMLDPAQAGHATAYSHAATYGERFRKWAAEQLDRT